MDGLMSGGGGQRSESEWWQMGRIVMNDGREETGR